MEGNKISYSNFLNPQRGRAAIVFSDISSSSGTTTRSTCRKGPSFSLEIASSCSKKLFNYITVIVLAFHLVMLYD